ncbi:MAG: hypothetical protein MK078_05590 [Crocinitomicaceae bacterium]|nr:hypothetical protein [Crocinitomicaceae bacterium]
MIFKSILYRLTLLCAIFGSTIAFSSPDFEHSFEYVLVQDDSLKTLDDSTNVTTNDTLSTEIVKADSSATKSYHGFENEDFKLFYRLDSLKLNKKEVVSNLLYIVNKSSEVQSIKLQNIYPAGWNLISLLDSEILPVQPNDTLFYPIILVPSKGFRPGSNILINSILTDTNDQAIGSHFFTVYSDKRISWETRIEPGDKVYLKNDETTGIIDYSLINTGPYEQDFFVELKPMGSNMIITDTSDRIIDLNTTLTMESGEDTTLTYKFNTFDGDERNINRISTLNYIPDYQFAQKKYTLFLQSRDPGEISGTNVKGNRIDFIKLPNEVYASTVSSRQLPLEVELNVQNVLNENVISTLNMRGMKQINRDASLIYYTQLNYSSVFIDNAAFVNAPWYVGYFDSKMQAEIGQVSGNIIGLNSFGKGAKYSYRFNDKHRAGAFYVQNPILFGTPTTRGYGAFYRYAPKNSLNFRVSGGRSANFSLDSRTNAANLNSNFALFNRHYFSLLLGGSNTIRNFSTAPETFNGFVAGLNYSTNYWERRIRTSLNARYNDRFFSNTGLERFQINHLTNAKITEKWSAVMTNFFSDNNAYNIFADTLLYTQRVLTNSLFFMNSHKTGSYQPGIFYDYLDIANYNVHYRGLLFRFSAGDFKRNFIVSTFFKAGYNDPIDLPDVKDFFSLINTTILRYRTWNMSFQYIYGPNSRVVLDRMLATGVVPQNVRFNLQNQYQFRKKNFVLENSLTYNYNNVFNSHSVAYFPQLFYFTNSGWRFAINASVIYNSNDFGSIYSGLNTLPIITEENTTTQTFNTNFGFSVRKVLNVPIPFIKAKSVDCDFVTFYDLNGNGVKDDNEPVIENVVINLDKTSELITDADGIGKFRNVEVGTHGISLMRLEGVPGWFPNVGDSITVDHGGKVFIPYVRGVKVYGEVILGRQEIAVVDKDKKIDLSRIQITATNSKVYHTLTDVDGKFEFYLPNGDYVITMDESILGTKFTMSTNNIPVSLMFGQSDVYVSFFISEKARTVKIKQF